MNLKKYILLGIVPVTLIVIGIVSEFLKTDNLETTLVENYPIQLSLPAISQEPITFSYTGNIVDNQLDGAGRLVATVDYKNYEIEGSFSANSLQNGSIKIVDYSDGKSTTSTTTGLFNSSGMYGQGSSLIEISDEQNKFTQINRSGNFKDTKLDGSGSLVIIHQNDTIYEASGLYENDLIKR